MTGDFIAKTQDYLHETTLTQEIRETIKQEGVKEYFVKSLQEKGVDEQTINTLLENEDIASLFGLNQESKDNPQQISQSNNEILLDAILVTPELSFAEILTNTMQSGARGIDTLVQAVGEDNAAMALMAIQVAVEGAPKTILSTIGDNALNTVREPTTDAMSSFINEKAFETQFLQNPDEQEAYAYLSDQLAELGFDFIFAGSYSIMRSSKKVTSADAKVDDVFENTQNTNGNIFTQKTQYQATDKGTGNNYTVYQRSDIDLDLVFKTKTGKITTNREIMSNGGTPYVKDANGNMVQLNLHHSQQQGSGPLFEVTSTTHQNSTNQNALHPYGQEKNPNDPVDRTSFGKDRNQYWQDRLNQIEEGN
jgi:hypothetical protein